MSKLAVMKNANRPYEYIPHQKSLLKRTKVIQPLNTNFKSVDKELKPESTKI